MTQEETSTRLHADDGFKICALFMPRHSERRYAGFGKEDITVLVGRCGACRKTS